MDISCKACGDRAEQWWNYCAMCGYHIAAGDIRPSISCRAQKKSAVASPEFRSQQGGAS